MDRSGMLRSPDSRRLAQAALNAVDSDKDGEFTYDDFVVSAAEVCACVAAHTLIPSRPPLFVAYGRFGQLCLPLDNLWRVFRACRFLCVCSSSLFGFERFRIGLAACILCQSSACVCVVCVCVCVCAAPCDSGQ